PQLGSRRGSDRHASHRASGRRSSATSPADRHRSVACTCSVRGYFEGVTRTLESAVSAIARQLAELGAGERSKVFRMTWWSERMLDWAMARPEFKTQLFRFVDVFPALAGNDDVAGHLVEYFEGIPVPRVLDLGVDVAGHVPFGRAIEARVARRNIMRMAEQFIVGQTPAEAVEGLHRLWRSGSAATGDLLGEKTIADGEADRY